ncbi:MAG: DMT family transporter [Dehalococcoidia bacterium]
MTGRQLLVLAGGVVAVSWAAPLIRLASEAGAPALAIAALRLGFAAPPMVALAAWSGTGDLRGLPRRDLALLAVASVGLALHFALWVASLERTSVATSVVLVTTQPVFVALGAWLFLRERPSRAVAAGIAIAAAGAVLLVSDDWGDLGTQGGNAMALGGAVSVSAYVIAGRRARQRLSLPSYTAVVYSLTAVLLLGAALVSGTAVAGLSAEAYLWIALMAVVAQLIGHNAINWTLGAVPAAVVAVAILGEPVGAGILASFVLDEVPTLLELAGGAVVLGGVFVALRGARRSTPALVEPIEV